MAVVLTNLADQPVRSYPKTMQTASSRQKLTQKQRGDISTKVDKLLKLRSGGMCEVKERCKKAIATERAHTTGRRIIENKTTEDDLFHACKACHVWLDETPEGIKFKRKVREVGTSAYLQQRR